MKQLSFIALLTLIFCLAASSHASSQELSKSETKEIKQELKKFKKNPLLYKVKLQKLHNQIAECDAEIEQEEEKTRDKNRQIKILNDSIRLMHTAIDMLVEEMEVMSTGQQPDYALEGTSDAGGASNTSMEIPEEPKGLSYKVQVGQFRLLDISDYFTGPKVFNYEMVGDKFTYNIGYFDKLENARRFAADVKKMGITDAFVTRYRNGKRVNK